MENPREYCLDSRTYLLYASKTRVIYKYDNGCEVVSRGFLRVTFSDDLKIVLWEFEAKVHEEYLPMSKIKKELGAEPQRRGSFNFVVKDQGTEKSKPEPMFEKSSVPTVISVDSLPKSHVNEFGLPPPVMRCFEITEVISYMKDLIDFALENSFSPIASLEKFHQQVAIPEMQLYQQHLLQQRQPPSQSVQSSQPANSASEQEVGTTSNTGKDETIKSEDSKKDKHESHGEDENTSKQDKPRELLLVDQSNQFKNGDEDDENDNQTDEEAPTNTRKRTKKTRPAPKGNKRRKTK